MAPVSAPFPTPRNLPFQCAASGIHNSVRMLESAVGVNVVVTLQKGKGADTVMVAALGALLLAVVVKGAVMSVADVTVPSSRWTPTRALHAVAAIGLRAVSSIAVDSAEQKSIATENSFSVFTFSSSRCGSGERGRRSRWSLSLPRSE